MVVPALGNESEELVGQGQQPKLQVSVYIGVCVCIRLCQYVYVHACISIRISKINNVENSKEH